MAPTVYLIHDIDYQILRIFSTLEEAQHVCMTDQHIWDETDSSHLAIIKHTLGHSPIDYIIHYENIPEEYQKSYWVYSDRVRHEPREMITPRDKNLIFKIFQ